MNGEQRTWSLVVLLMCISLTACIAIIAQCSINVDGGQTDAAECSKHGGTWHPSADPAARFCEEARK